MIVTIRSNSGYYRAVEFPEFKKDWYNYFANLRARVDFRFCKNLKLYRVKNNDIFKETFAPSFEVLKENVKIY